MQEGGGGGGGGNQWAGSGGWLESRPRLSGSFIGKALSELLPPSPALRGKHTSLLDVGGRRAAKNLSLMFIGLLEFLYCLPNIPSIMPPISRCIRCGRGGGEGGGVGGPIRD